MSVLVAHLTAECNEHVDHLADLGDCQLLEGYAAIEAMHIADIFKAQNIKLIPSIYAAWHPCGILEYSAFAYLQKKLMTAIRDNYQEIEGIYLQFHGASAVKDLKEVSAEHALLKDIRALVGKELPIAMVMDPHGNITKELADELNIVRCYRESPHADQIATERLVAAKLIDLLHHPRPMQPLIWKLPIAVGGERCVSAVEPLKTINKLLDEAEKDPRVFSSSYHIGYIRHDDDKLGAAVVIVPNNPADRQYCQEVGLKIATYAWEQRQEFKFSGNYCEAEDTFKLSLAKGSKTTVITDSGDNCGAGAAGYNTYLLRQALTLKTEKRILFAAITDPKALAYLSQKEIGAEVQFDLGVNTDYLSKSITICGKIVAVGEAVCGLTCKAKAGKAYTVKLDGHNIEVLIIGRNVQYGTMEQFHSAGLEFHDYDIVVVKMGYLDTYLIPETAYHLMSLTDGATIQRTEKITYKRVKQPLWPLTDFQKLYFIE